MDLLMGNSHYRRKDRTKNKISHRTALAVAFEELLLRLKEQQNQDCIQSKSSYCTEYLENIYMDKMGQRIKAGDILLNFSTTASISPHLEYSVNLLQPKP
ncbi:hypothetical protein [Paenibacillus albidus]|uniref:hypothetical protein n=1 Tax=Paenibacillus albidus TaxID=2041023 RepID=UPI001666B603|nr:hypothetical protein [Paenibacillus albidus]